MSKAILLSIKPEWLVKILNREKTIEVRKLFRKDYVGWVYLYCSKNKPYLISKLTRDVCFWEEKQITANDMLNGKVVARFWCDKVNEIDNIYGNYVIKENEKLSIHNECWLYKTCLMLNELDNYLNGKKGFAIHISKLEVFDKPRELSEFYTTKLDEDLTKRFDNSIQLENGTWVKPITKAPQNYCYVEGE